MPKMNWGAFDLNLLIVFDAVMRDRSVTRAGARVGLSQPAMSHALARLRHVLHDDLFIRTPKGMVPTARAEEIAEPIRRALGELQFSLQSIDTHPADAVQTIRIGVDPYAAVVLVDRIVRRCAEVAPELMLDIRGSGKLNLPEMLDRGDLDLAIGGTAEDGERFSRQPLMEDGFVAVLGCPGVQEFAIEELAAMPHLEISSLTDDLRFIDDALAEHGSARRIVLRSPYLSAGHVLAGSQMVAVLRRRMAERLAQAHGFDIHPLPHPSPRIETSMLWHRRLQGQAVHRRLRDLVAAVARDL
jgi:DNA-binding transcriptional LysR family regulator